MNLFSDIRLLIIEAVAELGREGVLPLGIDAEATRITVEPPRDPQHGDMSTNAAMVLGKRAGIRPRDLAEALAGKLSRDSRVATAEVAGPGFLNLRLTNDSWRRAICSALSEGSRFGRPNLGEGRRVNVEFVSANPTGPLHVAHARGAAFGDALANLLAFAGHEVTREYYVNDGGAQVDVLARSAYLRYLEANGASVEFAPDGYPGTYLVPVGEALKDLYGTRFVDRPETEWIDRFREFATNAMMDIIREDLSALGIRMDTFFSERALYGTDRIEAALRELDSRGLIYSGKLAPPVGRAQEDWEPRQQTLFRSTEHGDDVDRPIRKSDGSWTYFAPDIAYHFDKIERGFDELINVFGFDHGGYVKRIRAVVDALSGGRIPIEIKLVQLVRLLADGKPVMMSKRSGTFVTLRELVDEVGADVTRFVMLTRKNDVALDFDLEQVRRQSRDNPVFYVQYAHARIQSVLRKAGNAGFDVNDPALSRADLRRVGHDAEFALIRKVCEWPRLLDLAARNREPHRIAFFLSELAGTFHSLWNRSKAEPSLRFLQQHDPEGTNARLAVCRATGIVISSGLCILGVTPVDEMR